MNNSPREIRTKKRAGQSHLQSSRSVVRINNSTVAIASGIGCGLIQNICIGAASGAVSAAMGAAFAATGSAVLRSAGHAGYNDADAAAASAAGNALIFGALGLFGGKFVRAKMGVEVSACQVLAAVGTATLVQVINTVIGNAMLSSADDSWELSNLHAVRGSAVGTVVLGLSFSCVFACCAYLFCCNQSKSASVELSNTNNLRV